MSRLTQPQIRFLSRAMRADEIRLQGGEWVTAGTLARLGYVETASVGSRRVTRAGLEALLNYWMRKDAASGCLAYQQHRQEVEAALAARFPEPLKLAA